MISAGELDRRVTIEQRTVTRDAADGSQVVVWAPLATVWARMRESATSMDEQLRGDVMSYGRPTMVRTISTASRPACKRMTKLRSIFRVSNGNWCR